MQRGSAREGECVGRQVISGAIVFIELKRKFLVGRANPSWKCQCTERLKAGPVMASSAGNTIHMYEFSFQIGVDLIRLGIQITGVSL
jgi:hypothetical protein